MTATATASPAEQYFGTRTGRHTHPATHPAWMTFTDGDCPVCPDAATDLCACPAFHKPHPHHGPALVRR